MTIREWHIESPIHHDVRLEHGWFWGNAKLFVDGNVAYERPVTLVDFGFQDKIIIDETTYVVSVRPRGVDFVYSFGRSESPDPLADPDAIQQRRSAWIRGMGIMMFIISVMSIWAIIASLNVPD